MDEKGPSRPTCTSGTKRKSLTRPERSLTALLALVAVVSVWYYPPRILQFGQIGKPEKADWKWADIRPSKSLRWHECFDGKLDCARLDVPMDWLDPSPGERVVLAISRLRARHHDDYRGPVFFNPGGPGGSGIWALRDHGELLQAIVGKNHDILTFDPRGIGASVPRIDCWNSLQRRQFWQLQDRETLDAYPGVLYDTFARATAFSQTCERALNSSRILSHSSTVSHSRDMLEILNQLGYEKLKYWGFSYGTILGGTFAALYPNKIDRLVSDGNVDYREWYLGEHINFIRDADKVMDAFYTLCHRAGPSRCAFYAPSAAEIKARLDTLLSQLRVRPVIVPIQDESLELPELVTYSTVKRLISSVLYRPIHQFHHLAEVLEGLERGDGRPYHELVNSGDSTTPSFCGLEPVPPTVPLEGMIEDTDDAFPAILCVDGPPLTESVLEFEKYVKQVQKISTATGSVAVLARLACAGRQVRPKWRFTGPFDVHTSHPILFIANIADNITPLVSARNNSQGFHNSVVLIQNSYGHTSLAGPSTCTAKYIRSYFQDGTLPEPNTECEPDSMPFGLEASGVHIYDGELTPAVQELSHRTRRRAGRFHL